MEKNLLIDKIINILRESQGPITLLELSKSFNFKSDSADYQILKSLLNELCTLNILKKMPRRKYVINDYEDNSIIEGMLKFKNDRTFLELQNDDLKKIFIKKKQQMTAFAGDFVRVKILRMKGDKGQGEVIKILNRANHIINGLIEFDNNVYYLLPENARYYVDFIIPKNKLHGAKHNDRVKAEFISWEDRMKSPIAEVKEIIRKTNEPITEFDSVIEEYYLPWKFKDDVLAEAEEAAKPVSSELIKKRYDLRNETIITIDPVDAKDFDDALSLKTLKNGNYELGVHIADVSHYIRENSNLDNEAKWRGNSIYLVDRVIPMLPEKLSNNICSLQPNKVRLAFSVFMEFTNSGEMENYEIIETVIKSKKRFNYDEVDLILETGEGPYSDLLSSLNKLAGALRQNRFSKGGIDFETFEVKFMLENGIPERAALKKSTSATILVEECMLAANQVVANHIKHLSKENFLSSINEGDKKLHKLLHKKKETNILPFIYRVHEEPELNKLKDVLEFLRTIKPSISLKGNSSNDINKFLHRFENLPEKPIVHQMLLRAMTKAAYLPRNKGHYGLGFSDYTHFTSPIRRYPDLVVHRLLKEYSKGLVKPDRIEFLEKETKIIAEHCSERERIALEAERASVKVAQTILASNYIGIDFIGTISGIVKFGIFVLLDDIYAEGLLHVNDLKDDYYVFDEQNHCLVGKRTKRTFNIGKRIRVKIYRVNLEDRKIDLSLLPGKAK